MIKDLKLRAYAEINLDDLIFNLKKINEGLKPGTAMCCVVKADAYGHGAVQVSKAVSELDFVKFLAVATPEEGGEIRENGVDIPILILSPSFPDSLETVINNDLRPSVFTEEQLSALSDMAVIAGKTVKIHVPVDTGMSRIGVRPDEEGLLFIKKAANTPGISLEGVFTHLSRADETDPVFSRDRAGVFMDFCGKIGSSGVDVPICHCSNSAGIMTIPEANMDMVRVGITMYGLSPSSEVTREMAGLKSVMGFHSSISYIKEIPAGTPVSYGGTYVSDKVMRIATVAAGYADGYPRLLSNKGCVLIRGKRAPILGRVCMDQFMVDVTGIPEAQVLDDVLLFGRIGDEGSDGEACRESISAEEVGEISGRFNYELTSLVTLRVPRVYVKDGSPFLFEDRFGRRSI